MLQPCRARADESEGRIKHVMHGYDVGCYASNQAAACSEAVPSCVWQNRPAEASENKGTLGDAVPQKASAMIIYPQCLQACI